MTETVTAKYSVLSGPSFAKEITIKNDTLFLIGLNDDEEEVEATITQNEIYSLLEKKGAFDF